jgi:hypothetical protein
MLVEESSEGRKFVLDEHGTKKELTPQWYSQARRLRDGVPLKSSEQSSKSSERSSAGAKARSAAAEDGAESDEEAKSGDDSDGDGGNHVPGYLLWPHRRRRSRSMRHKPRIASICEELDEDASDSEDEDDFSEEEEEEEEEEELEEKEMEPGDTEEENVVLPGTEPVLAGRLAQLSQRYTDALRETDM